MSICRGSHIFLAPKAAPLKSERAWWQCKMLPFAYFGHRMKRDCYMSCGCMLKSQTLGALGRPPHPLGWSPRNTSLSHMRNWVAVGQTYIRRFAHKIRSYNLAFQGHSRSPKVTRFNWVRMTFYYWSIRSNYKPFSYCFRDTRRFRTKNANFPYSSPVFNVPAKQFTVGILSRCLG